MASLTVPRRVESVRPATAFVVNTARALSVPAAEEPIFEVAVSEAITNAVRHGGEPESAMITCQLQLDRGDFTLRVMDGGDAFDLPKTDLPDISAGQIEALPASGYGVPIMRSVFPVVRVINVNGRFGVEMTLTSSQSR